MSVFVNTNLSPTVDGVTAQLAIVHHFICTHYNRIHLPYQIPDIGAVFLSAPDPRDLIAPDALLVPFGGGDQLAVFENPFSVHVEHFGEHGAPPLRPQKIVHHAHTVRVHVFDDVAAHLLVHVIAFQVAPQRHLGETVHVLVRATHGHLSCGRRRRTLEQLQIRIEHFHPVAQHLVLGAALAGQDAAPAARATRRIHHRSHVIASAARGTIVFVSPPIAHLMLLRAVEDSLAAGAPQQILRLLADTTDPGGGYRKRIRIGSATAAA